MGATIRQFMINQDMEQSKTNRNLFDFVPIDILYLISDYLQTEDLHNAEKLSTAWYSLLTQNKFWMRRYDVSPDTAIEICKRFHADENCRIKDGYIESIKVLAADMNITWLNGRYLSKENDVNLGHEIVRLNYVCWLHLTTTIENVVPGTYNVWWRMLAKDPNVHGVTSIQVKDSNNSVIGELRLTSAHFRDAAHMFGNEWFYFRIENIKVPRLETISITFHCEDGHVWKHGLCWDFVEMSRITHPDRLKDVYNPLERDHFTSRTSSQGSDDDYDFDEDNSNRESDDFSE